MGPRYCSWWKEPDIHKPAGGWAPVHVEAVCRVWSLRHTDIRVTRLLPRVYFALVEIAQRRGHGRSRAARAHYGPQEVCQLIGLEDNPRNHGWIRRAVTLLREADLVQWEKDRLQIRTRFPDVGMSSMAEQIKRSARRVPVPRRLFRRLAAAGRAEMATLLGALIRCLHNHHDVIRRAGRLQVTWVASIFGLSRSAIITAKKKLLGEGILVEHTTPQWEMNKAGWGVRTTINVDWSPPRDPAPGIAAGSTSAISRDREVGTPEKPCHSTSILGDRNNTATTQNTARWRSDSERPCLNHHLSSSKQEEKHQHPGRERHRPSGVSNTHPAPGRFDPQFSGQRKAKRPRKLRIISRGGEAIENPGGSESGERIKIPAGVVLEDLGSLERLGELFHQRTGRWGGSGDRDFLDHVAAAVRATTRGRDATAMFAWALRHPEKIRRYITSEEEEQARRWILRERGGIDPAKRKAVASDLPGVRTPPAALDVDERIVRACLETASKPCGRGVEPFVLARRFKQWTRSRWDAAHAAYRLKMAGRVEESVF